MRVAPSISEASSSLRPSWVNTAPLPALNSGLSSSTVIAAVTASSAGLPAASSAWPVRKARVIAARSAASSASLVPSRWRPAPPWITSIVAGASTARAGAVANGSRAAHRGRSTFMSIGSRSYGAGILAAGRRRGRIGVTQRQFAVGRPGDLFESGRLDLEARQPQAAVRADAGHTHALDFQRLAELEPPWRLRRPDQPGEAALFARVEPPAVRLGGRRVGKRSVNAGRYRGGPI